MDVLTAEKLREKKKTLSALTVLSAAMPVTALSTPSRYRSRTRPNCGYTRSYHLCESEQH